MRPLRPRLARPGSGAQLGPGRAPGRAVRARPRLPGAGGPTSRSSASPSSAPAPPARAHGATTTALPDSLMRRTMLWPLWPLWARRWRGLRTLRSAPPPARPPRPVQRARAGPRAPTRAPPPSPAWLHPGRSGALALGPQVLAVFGELRPSAAKALGLRQRAAVAEVFVDAVPARRRPRAKTPAAARRLQPVRRDFAFVMEAEAGAESLLRAVAGRSA